MKKERLKNSKDNLSQNSEKKKTFAESFAFWESYNNFVRSLHLQYPLKKPTLKEKVFSFLKKILVVFCAAFFTKFAFYFLIDPNNIYNSGLSGVFQTIAKVIISKKDYEWDNFRLIYHGISLIVNSFLIIVLWYFFNSDLEIISTAFFYVLSQFFWTWIFDKFNFLFNGFRYSNEMKKIPVSITLPYYMIIALIAAVIYAFGISLIIRAQATPGEHDLVMAHLSLKKKKYPLSLISLFFKMFIVFLLIIYDIFFSDQKSILRRKWEQMRKEDASLLSFSENWKKIEELKEEIKKKENSEEINKIKEENKFFFDFLLHETNIEKEEFRKHANSILIPLDEINNEEIDKMIKKLKKKENRRSNVSATPMFTFNEIESSIIKKLEEKKQINEKKISFILKKITSDPRLLATIFYIIISSYLSEYFFPRERIVPIYVHCQEENDLNSGLDLLSQFSPVFLRASVYHSNEKKEMFIIMCWISKWNYYLLFPKIRQIGDIYTND